MHNSLKFGLAALAALAMSACTTYQSVSDMAPTGSAFQKAAHKEYLAQAKLEVDEGDWPNANYYIKQAKASAEGVTVMPADFTYRDRVPADKRPDLQAGRDELMGYLDGGARERIPQKAAYCQGVFECWMEEEDEGHQPKDIKYCRDLFTTCVAELAPPKPAPMPKPAPKPMVEKVAGPFVIYFGFDSAELDANDMAILDQVEAEYKKNPNTNFTVKAHTDTMGNAAYNQKLSERRAAAVASELKRRGLPQSMVKEEAFGETDLPVKTKDNVKVQANRRATIYLVR